MPPNLVVYAPGYSPVEVGCDLWDDCFHCPLDASFCGKKVNMITERIKTAAVLLFNSGNQPREIAKKLGVSEKQIRRYLKKLGKRPGT